LSQSIIFEHDPRAIKKRLLVFQGIPLISIAIAFGLASGLLQMRSASGMSIALIVGLLLYAFVMAILLQALRSPIFLMIDESGKLCWRPYFTVIERKLPADTQIIVKDRQVTISPAVDRLLGTSTKNGVTIFSLPEGFKPYREMHLRI
jgi:hypothetical protein